VPLTKHNPATLYPQFQNYSHAMEISSGSRLLMTSGLIARLTDGQTVPETFEEQGDVIWQHLGTILKSAGMTYSNLVSLRTYLVSPEYGVANTLLRKKYLGDHEVLSTVVCAQLLDPRWKLEMEAVAAE
jgi:2-iminobutanoate/2-iminopropanoate deaminase